MEGSQKSKVERIGDIFISEALRTDFTHTLQLKITLSLLYFIVGYSIAIIVTKIYLGAKE